MGGGCMQDIRKRQTGISKVSNIDMKTDIHLSMAQFTLPVPQLLLTSCQLLHNVFLTPRYCLLCTFQFGSCRLLSSKNLRSDTCQTLNLVLD